MSIQYGGRKIFFLLYFLGAASYAENTSFAFFYGAHPPISELKTFDHIIVDPDHLSMPPKDIGDKNKSISCQWFAYTALGEVNPSRKYYSKIPKNWYLGTNKTWGSVVIDQSQPDWPDFYLSQVIKPLWDAGYRGFFLDALDSYELFSHDDVTKVKQIQGMVTVIQKLKQAYPHINLVLNRGFELLPQIHEDIMAVVFESLFQSWSQSQKKYEAVTEEDRSYLLTQANNITKNYALPVVSIDYVSASNPNLARETAERIQALGIIPWVSSPALDRLGVGATPASPRKILMIYDGDEDKEIFNLSIHFADPMVTYLGYVPEYKDIRNLNPTEILNTNYAGIICWVNSGFQPIRESVSNYLLEQINAGIKIIFLGDLPFPTRSNYEKVLGFSSIKDGKHSTLAKVVFADSIMAFELPPLPNSKMLNNLRIRKGKVLLQIAGNMNDTMDAAAFTPWGAYALNPYVLKQLPDHDHERWEVNPLEFIAKGLQLKPSPVPDVTTENGVRLLIVHVDGDGFANRAEWAPNAWPGEVLLKEILTHYPFATTFSIIEGEVSEDGMYPKLSPELVSVAKKIFALPNVEIASHTYSHPFDWGKFSLGGDDAKSTHLDIPGFVFNSEKMNREITGSIVYINQVLAPKDKKCKVLLWSGNCNPDSRTVALTYSAGVANMNGGETIISNTYDSWTDIAPIGINRDGYYQVFAPNQNENIYTHEWTGPFYGYSNVIETFEKTDSPIRFKPVDIYYHSYSGSKLASLTALKKVYEWAYHQKLFNVYVSEYTPKVLDFTTLSISHPDSGWEINSQGQIRELRIPTSMGYPDLKKSQGVIGFSDIGNVRYVHLTGQNKVKLYLSPLLPNIPFVWKANAKITNWTRNVNEISMSIQGHLNLEFSMTNINGCRVFDHESLIQGKREADNRIAFSLTRPSAELKVVCKP